MKRYIVASWNGVYSPRFLKNNCDLIKNSQEAKIMSDYMYENNIDDGFRHQDDILECRWQNLDDIYQKAMEWGKQEGKI